MPAETAGIRARLDAWRAQGADRVDPSRFALMDALAQHAARHEGSVRKQLDARLQVLADAYADLLTHPPQAGTRGVETGASPFKPLLEQLANASRLDAMPQTASTPRTDDAGEPAPAAEPSTMPLLDEFQQLWSRIRIDSLLRQCLDGLPEDAGPLHSTVLTYRAMALMREVCPDYLQHFIAYADTLTWLEQLGGSTDADDAISPRKPPRTGSPRRKKLP
ncbi:DUF2894 domain-containing protein [Stenotrophomonas sp. NLF4-10]|uniref:DUF2894 domain-containing protein n=1 Tax=Stenotrophomonas sp. NLF4-10 TaxID=2918754 RepID=UPI001EFBC10D|nr:DUF2894 domain-containing protein [Stenotrophomonas sp. NLF4-10]MCG8274981.1 DUF2894 domain-containing protein [Stenotrophomonas sp. NLF4-10]